MARVSGRPVAPPKSLSQEASPDAIFAAGLPTSISLDGLDKERLARLRKVKVKVRQPAIAELVREQAVRAQASTPFVSDESDRECVRTIIKLFMDTYYRTGQVDPRRALRRSSIDRYLTEGSGEVHRTVRWHLYVVGRVFYPREFPPAAGLTAPRMVMTRPTSTRDLRALYSLSLTLNPKWSAVLRMLLDFIVGVGARSAELKYLTRTDIAVQVINGRRWVLVRLHTPKTPPRIVPVWDPAIAERIERYAAESPHRHLMAFGQEPTVERNAINRVNDKIADLGYEERLDAKALRNRWLVQMAGMLPLTQFLAIAGRSDPPRSSEIGLDPAEKVDLTTITTTLTNFDRANS